jgi:hypothetical protein
MKLGASLLAASSLLLMQSLAFAAKLDGGIYLRYNLYPDATTVYWMVCGQLVGGDGCYAHGELSNLERPCAVMEGKSKQKGNVVTRYVYVFDKRSSTKKPGLVNVYLRQDTITDDYVSTDIPLVQQIDSGISGSPTANCFMAGSDSNVYVGTDASQVVARLRSSDLKISAIHGYSDVQSMTADQRGWVAITFFNSSSLLYDPNGTIQGEGGGLYQLSNARNAFTNNYLTAPR